MMRCCWEIDVDARTPRAAARKALAIQRDPQSIATVFDVQYRGRMVRVDLTENKVRRISRCKGHATRGKGRQGIA
jgi:uncharacterized protein YhbP (UPF0306 family)